MAATTYSEEQHAYITYIGQNDTKLLATAGSGKTFCIIHHIQHLLDQNIYEPQQIVVLTFSKNARDDFVNKLRKFKVTLVNRSNVHTIDSFAWKLLGKRATETDVSILSYTFMLDLESMEPHEVIHTFPKLKDIKCVFIDEAQDLNDTQYRLLIALKNKCHIALHFVGDPNQNIFQFRRSSDKYLINHDAKTFHLTKNYRSQGHIVEFCSQLRPYKQREISYDQPKGFLDITFYAYENSNTFENYLLSILYMFQAKRIPLHKCAILAPTRGYVKDSKGVCKYKGLCYISNLLYSHNIPFQQFYSDTGASSSIDGQDTVKIKYKPQKGSINLMTYTASKGLEWDYVIIIDANAHLISRHNYTQDQFEAEKYLLYVACSRPRKNLIIFTKRNYANPWFRDIPDDKYKIARMCQHNFDFFDTSKLFDQSNGTSGDAAPNDIMPKKSVATLINALDEESLHKINAIVSGKVKRVNTTMFEPCQVESPTTNLWRLKCPDPRRVFLGKFMEHLAHIHASGGAPQDNTHLVMDVRNVVHSTNVLLCDNERVIHWYYQNRVTMTWELYDMEKKSLQPYIVNFVDSYLDRSHDFNTYTLVDKFYNTFIISNKALITSAFERYLARPTDLHASFFISLVSYAIQTTHYFYIQQCELFENDILSIPENKSTFQLLSAFFAEHPQHVQDHYYRVNGEDMYGVVDFTITEREGLDRLAKIRFSSDITLKDVLNMIITCILYGTEQFTIFNLAIGLKTDVTFELSNEDQLLMMDIIKVA